ncbi:MAG TPA: ATP-binding protein, partial [Polyangiaceae bacterium]|nr:ATP-binding protein [Polyangiaceae bacterium]
EPYVTTKMHGTGLGLSIVQRIVIEHGGEIAYEPQPTGACFAILLPCAGPVATETTSSIPLGE